MSVENAPQQGITLYSHEDDFRSHWIRFLLAEKQIKHTLIIVEEDDEDLASLNPVSYTHLDVYKRQLFSRMLVPCLSQ